MRMQAIKFILNGVPGKVITDPKKSLSKVIREDFRLTGTKEGCFASHCGTCTVISHEEIKSAFQAHICRCTGYQKIFKAKVTYGTA